MIERFCIQTKDSVLDFLSEIGKDKEVFSTFSCMEIEGFMVYFYAMPMEIVLVLIDIVDEGTVEIADKDVRWTEPYLNYFRKVLPNGEVSKNSKDMRMSPAMVLYNHAWEMRRFFSISNVFSVVPAIHLVYLTNSHIVNYPKVIEKWQQNQWKKNEFGFTVLHSLQNISNLGYGDIPVNMDFSLEASEYWTKWQTYLKNRGWFDWANDCWYDWPQPSEKRYKWKGQMGHLISDEFKK